MVMMIITTSPQFWRGILPPRHGNQPVNLPWGDAGMQPLLCHLRFYHLNAFSIKVIGQICLIWNTCFSFFYSCLFAFVILILDLPYTPHIVSLLCCAILWIRHIWYDISGKSTPHHRYMFRWYIDINNISIMDHEYIIASGIQRYMHVHMWGWI